MSRTTSPSTGRPYGLARVCRAWRVARATLYRHRAPVRDEPRRRPGPVGPMRDADLVQAIRAVLAASPFHGEGHRKVWARLRLSGTRTSKCRVLRLMREHDLPLPPGRLASGPAGPRRHDHPGRGEPHVGNRLHHHTHRRGTGYGLHRPRPPQR